MRATLIVGAVQALGFVLAAGVANAQEGLATNCSVGQLSNATFRAQCFALAQGAAIAQARMGLAAAGGNPLPGSSSTLGMRMGSTPRISANLRLTGTRMSVPAANADLGSSARPDASVLTMGVNADVAVGLYGGMSPAPTVGGVGSIDLIGSAGFLPNPGNGFHGSRSSIAAGLRVGVLRESFTAPGITLSGIYRRVGDTSYGTSSAVVPPSYLGEFNVGPTTDWSLRGVVGKRLFFIATSVGAGLDRYSSKAHVAWSCPPNASCIGDVSFDVASPLKQTRPILFADFTWTSLVFNATAEVGWQKGGSPATVTPATGYEDLVRKGALFGSLALRLTI